MVGKTSQKTLNMFLGQPCCICIKENNFDVKGSGTNVAGIYGCYMDSHGSKKYFCSKLIAV